MEEIEEGTRVRVVGKSAFAGREGVVRHVRMLMWTDARGFNLSGLSMAVRFEGCAYDLEGFGPGVGGLVAL